MQIAPSVSFHDIPVSPGLEAEILEHVRKLEHYCDGIISCRVVLSVPHRHRHGSLYGVRIDLTVPGEEIVIDREPGLDHAHEDVHVAIRDAFHAARRKLQDHVRRVRGFVKSHARPSPAPEAPLPASSSPASPLRRPSKREVEIPAGPVVLAGTLTIPAGAHSLVLFAHGSGSSRRSPRNVYVAEVLQSERIATLLFDLLTEEEAKERSNVFDVALLSARLEAAVRWVHSEDESKELRTGLFGASTGAAAAVLVASRNPSIGAVVSRGGRPDLAAEALPFLAAPTLLIVGGADPVVLDLNRKSFDLLRCPKELAVVPGAGHLFEEPGTLEVAARRARSWFVRWLSLPESGNPRRAS